MSTALNLDVRAFCRAVLESGVSGASGGVAMSVLDETIRLTNGTSTGQVDRAYYGERTLTSSASETLDLAGSLADLFANTLTFVKVKYIAVKVMTTTDGVDLKFGPNATNGAGIGGFWTAAGDKTIVPAGGFVEWYDPNGWTVTAGTADLLYALNVSGSASVTYRVLIVGTSA